MSKCSRLLPLCLRPSFEWHFAQYFSNTGFALSYAAVSAARRSALIFAGSGATGGGSIGFTGSTGFAGSAGAVGVDGSVIGTGSVVAVVGVIGFDDPPPQAQATHSRITGSFIMVSIQVLIPSRASSSAVAFAATLPAGCVVTSRSRRISGPRA